MNQKKQISPTFIYDDYKNMVEEIDAISEDLHTSYIEKYIHLQRIRRELARHLDVSDSGSKELIDKKTIVSEMINEDVLLITMDHLLPMINDKNLKEKRFFNEMRNHYVPAMTDAILKGNTNFELEKAFVAVVQHYPKRIIRDIDNHFIKFIFNSLRYSGVVEDDSYEHLYYMMFGTLDTEKKYDTGYTEIYVTASEKMQKVIEILPLNHFANTEKKLRK